MVVFPLGFPGFITSTSGAAMVPPSSHQVFSGPILWQLWKTHPQVERPRAAIGRTLQCLEDVA